MPLLEILRAEKTLYNRSIQFILGHTQLVSTEQRYQLSYLDQLYATACRLYHDLDLPNHKYIAYQIALLYVRHFLTTTKKKKVDLFLKYL